jgi:hypothetical protein
MKKKFLITLSLISILSAILTVYAWTNPNQNPPLGGGVLQTDTSGLKIVTTTRITSGNLIVNTGNVGIGTTAPGARLHVEGGDIRIGTVGRGIWWDWPNRVIEVIDPGDGTSRLMRFRNSMGAGQGNPLGGFDFADYAGNSVLRINNGNVGIGTTAPSQKLHVAGGSAVVGYIAGSSGGVFIAQPAAYGQPAIQGVTSTFAPGTLAINPVGGNVGIGTTAPSWGKLQIEDAAVPLAFRETDQTGAGSLWRMPLDGKILRFDVSQNGTDFTSYVVPLAMTPSGNVGIGTISPVYKLDIVGDVRWSGTLQGGSVPWARLTSFPPGCPSGQFVTAIGGSLICGQGVSGSGSTNYVAKWTGPNTLGNSIIYDNGSAVGIGTTAPGATLDVAGTIIADGFGRGSCILVDSAANGGDLWCPAGYYVAGARNYIGNNWAIDQIWCCRPR